MKRLGQIVKPAWRMQVNRKAEEYIAKGYVLELYPGQIIPPEEIPPVPPEEEEEVPIPIPERKPVWPWVAGGVGLIALLALITKRRK